MPKRLTVVIVTVILIMSLGGGNCWPHQGAACDFPKADSKANALASVSGSADLSTIAETVSESADLPSASTPTDISSISQPADLSAIAESADLPSASTPTDISSISQPADLSAIAESTDTTADWKVYTNAQYGYEIRYPNTWYIRENNANTPGIAIRHILQHTDFSPARDYDHYKSQAFFCSVIVWENHLNLPIEDWLKRENPRHPALLSGQTVIIGNKKIILHEPQGNAYYINAWIANHDRTYQVFSCDPSGKHAYAAIFNLMLKTLRFTPQPSGNAKAGAKGPRHNTAGTKEQRHNAVGAKEQRHNAVGAKGQKHNAAGAKGQRHKGTKFFSFPSVPLFLCASVPALSIRCLNPNPYPCRARGIDNAA